MFLSVAIAAGALLGFTGGGGASGAGRGNTASGDGNTPYVAHTTIGAPTAAFLRDAIKECDGPRFRHNHGSSSPTVFAGPLALAVGGGKIVGLIAINDGITNVCAVQVPRLGPDGPGFQQTGSGLNQETPGADKLFAQGLSSTGSATGSETWALGRTGHDVLAVTFVFKHRPAVSTRVKNGWYMAWWPGAISTVPISVRVTTKTGTVDSPMPGPQCKAHPSSCAFTMPNGN